jgi:hypothetical protein
MTVADMVACLHDNGYDHRLGRSRLGSASRNRVGDAGERLICFKDPPTGNDLVMTDDRASQLEAQTPNDNTTLLEVLHSYEHAGYLGDFSVDDEANVLCHTCQNRANPADIQALSLRRLEGASDPSDMLAIVALSCPVCDTKGLLLVNYGPEASAEQARVLIALDDRRGQGSLPDAQTPDEAEASAT